MFHCLAPVRFEFIEDRLYLHRLADVDINLAKVLSQRPDSADQSDQRFLFLFGASKFPDERITLDELFVAEVDRHEKNRAAWILHI